MRETSGSLADQGSSGKPGDVGTIRALASESISSGFVERVPIAFARRFAVLGLQQRNGLTPVAVASLQSLHALDKVAVLLPRPVSSFQFLDLSKLPKRLQLFI